MQFGIMHMPSVQSGMNFNMMNEYGVDRDGGVIDYCRLNDITIQTWSSLQYGFFEGCFVDNDRFPELNRVLSELAEKYSVSKTAIAIAWILRHPAGMQPVTGTTNPERLKECFRAADVTLTREEWYKVYLATGSFLP
jgi:predicted oxidoreductase